MELMYKMSLWVEEERKALKELSSVKAAQIQEFRSKIDQLQWAAAK